MHHRIMVRRERESTNQIARFGTPKLPIPAISNASPAEKQTPAQSLRGLFTDDELVNATEAINPSPPTARQTTVGLKVQATTLLSWLGDPSDRATR
jgi:hypothetical protein